MMYEPKGFPWEELGRKMAIVFKALGDVNRMKIIKILASNPDESICVVDLGKILGITQPATSQHIKVLQNINIVSPKRIKNKTFYAINSGQLRDYNKIIDEMFKKAFQRCTYDGDCTTCPDRGNCK